MTKVHVVNAFSQDGAGGNPAGVVLDAQGLSDEQMQKIAHEVGASETAFVLPSSDATHRLRFFTPTTEVDLCGHATVATWSLIREQDIHPLGEYTQDTMAGKLAISVEEHTVFMQQPEQKLGDTFDRNLVQQILGIKPEDLSTEFEPQSMNGACMVALNSEDTLNNLKPDLDAMAKLSDEHDCFAFHVFVLHGEGELLASVRDFGPAIGVPEDPATGTSNGSLLAYLKATDKLPKQNMYKIQQGVAINRPSLILGKFQGDRVWIGGEATVKRVLELEV